MGKTMLEKNVPPFWGLFPTSCRTWRRKNISLFNGNGYMLELSHDLFDYVGEPMGLTKFISDVNEGFGPFNL